jgi:hypothetical protein
MLNSILQNSIILIHFLIVISYDCSIYCSYFQSTLKCVLHLSLTRSSRSLQQWPETCSHTNSCSKFKVPIRLHSSLFTHLKHNTATIQATSRLDILHSRDNYIMLEDTHCNCYSPTKICIVFTVFYAYKRNHSTVRS